MKNFLRVIPFIMLGMLLTECSKKCDDCAELTTKNVIYTDPQGNNLFFGDSAIFNPDSVYFQVGNSETFPAGQNPKKGALTFLLSENDEKYLLILPNSTIDTLEFNVSQEKSERCCGYKPKSTKTVLNSIEIQNTDPITIVKDF